jgi:hypothetical protein
MAEPLQIAFKLLGLLFTLFMIYVLVAGSITLVLYTRIGQGDPKGFWYTDRDKLKKYIFKSWIDWAGYPSTFSFKEQSTVISSTAYKSLSNVAVTDCMLKCESANSRAKTPKCVGFTYSNTSNTCMLMSTMDGITPSSNTLYFIDGFDTAREYIPYERKTQTDATFISGSPYESSEVECLSNCVSQVDCTGIQLSGTPKMCGLVKNMDPAKFTDDAGKIMVFLGPHGSLKASTVSYY